MTDYNEKIYPLIDRDGSVGKSIENIAINKMGGPDTIRKTFIDEGSKRTMVHTRGESAQPEVKVSKGKSKSKVWAWPWHGVAYHNGTDYVTETPSGVYPTRGVSPASVRFHHSVLLTAVPDGLEPALIPEPDEAPEGSVWVNYATVSNGILFGEDVGLGSWIWTNNDVAYLVKSTINGTTSVSLEIHLLSDWVAGMAESAAADFVGYNSKDFKSPYMFKAPPSGAARTPVANLTVDLPALVGGSPSTILIKHGDVSFNGANAIFAYTVGMPDSNVAGSDKWVHGIGAGAPNFEFNDFTGMTETHHCAMQWVQLRLTSSGGIAATFSILDRTGVCYREGQLLFRNITFAYKANELARFFCKARFVGSGFTDYIEGQLCVDYPYAAEAGTAMYIKYAGRTVGEYTFNKSSGFFSITTVNDDALNHPGGVGEPAPTSSANDIFLEAFLDYTTLTYEPVAHHETAPVTPIRSRAEAAGSDEYSIFWKEYGSLATWDEGMLAEGTPNKYRRYMVARFDGYNTGALCALGSKWETSAPWAPPNALGPNDFKVPYKLTPCLHISSYGTVWVQTPVDYHKNLTISFSPTDISSGTPQPGVVYGIPPDADTIKPKRFV